MAEGENGNIQSYLKLRLDESNRSQMYEAYWLRFRAGVDTTRMVDRQKEDFYQQQLAQAAWANLRAGAGPGAGAGATGLAGTAAGTASTGWAAAMTSISGS